MYFTEKDIAERLFFGKRQWHTVQHFLTGYEGEFGKLTFVFYSMDGSVDKKLVYRVFLKDKAHMEEVVKSALTNMKKLIQEIILQFSG